MMRTRMLMLHLGLVMIAFMGCTQQPLDVNRPQPWELTLYRATADRRYTYFEIDRKGMLHFGGGKNANLRIVEPIVQLNDEQRQQLWRIIVEEQLLDARQAVPWSAEAWREVRKQQYDLSMTVGNRIRSLRCIDDQPASGGLHRLHDALYQIQTQVRYSDKSPAQLTN